MTGKAITCVPFRLLLVLLWLPGSGVFGTPAVRADGGHVALHATSGAYSVTLFTAPVPLVAGPCDLSLLVQDAASGEVLSDVAATVMLTRGSAVTQTVALARSAAGNRLLLSGQANLAEPGDYRLRVQVRRPGSQEVELAGTLGILANHSRRSTLLFGLAVPAAAILLFLLNQHAKMKMGIRRRM